MRSAFFGFNVARSALFLAQGGLNTVGHNVANASNEAFSRQFVVQQASRPLGFRDGRGMIGTGSEVVGIGQHRDVFLDRMFWSENSSLGRHDSAHERLRQMELSLNELRGTGTVSGFGLFFSSLQNLDTSAGDNVMRLGVLQAARGISEFVTMQARELRRQQLDTNHEIELTVRQINSIGQRIRNLNEQIGRSEITGDRANDLRDERNRLVDELSMLINVEVRESQTVDGALRTNITINGQEFINGSHIRPLDLVPRPTGAERNPTDAHGLFDIIFAGGASFDMYSPTLRGQLRGLIDVRDGNNGLFVQASAAQGTLTVDTTGTPHTITITDLSRDDLNATGVVRIFSTSPQGAMYVRYENLVFDPVTNSYTMELLDDIPPTWNVNQVEIGRTNNFKGIPHYMNRLNNLVRTFAEAINLGVTRAGDPIPYSIPSADRHLPPGATQIYDLFTLGEHLGPNWRSNALFNFSVNDILMNNPGLLAVSSDGDMGVSHGDVVEGWIQVGYYAGLFSEGRLSDFLIAMTGELAIDIRQEGRFQSNHRDTTASIHNQRLSVMGVDINEESINMIRFQQIYTAAANLINVLDQIYDTTINRLGTGF